MPEGKSEIYQLTQMFQLEYFCSATAAAAGHLHGHPRRSFIDRPDHNSRPNAFTKPGPPPHPADCRCRGRHRRRGLGHSAGGRSVASSRTTDDAVSAGRQHDGRTEGVRLCRGSLSSPTTEAVSAGQPLVRLDNRQYGAMLEQAKATDRRPARPTSNAPKPSCVQQQATIVQARAQVLGSRAAEAHAIAEVKRYEPLVATGAEIRREARRSA